METKNVRWKHIDGFEDYLINSLGQVLSLKYGEPRFLSASKGSGRYFQVTLSHLVDGKAVHKTFRIHRLVAEAFLEQPEGKDQVDHLNGDSFDNRVENLAWATAKENSNNPITAMRKTAGLHRYWSKNRTGDVVRWTVMVPGEWIDENGGYHYDPVLS